MGFMTSLFNRPRTVAVPLEKLAHMVEPFMDDSAKEPPTLKDISEAWSEARIWLCIGFEFEHEKGQMFWSLQKAMSILSATVAAAPPDAKTVALRRIDLQVIGAASIQMLEAARCLKEIYPGMRSRPALIRMLGDDGTVSLHQDFSNTMPIWTRPDSDHYEMGQNMRSMHDRIEAFMAETGIKPASEEKIYSYCQPRL